MFFPPTKNDTGLHTLAVVLVLFVILVLESHKTTAQMQFQQIYKFEITYNE